MNLLDHLDIHNEYLRKIQIRLNSLQQRRSLTTGEAHVLHCLVVASAEAVTKAMVIYTSRKVLYF